MIGTLVHQLTRNLTEEQIKTAGFDAYFVDHTTGVFPQFASGYPWSAATMQVTGDKMSKTITIHDQEGNYREYEEDKRRRMGDDAAPKRLRFKALK